MKRMRMGGAARRGWMLGLLLLAALGRSPNVLAQDEGDEAGEVETAGERKRVLVGKLDGAKTESAREWIVQAFQSDGGYELVGDEQALELDTGASESDIADAASAVKADVVVLGESVFKGKNGWVAKLAVHEGTSGQLIENVEVTEKTFEAYETSLSGGQAFLPVAAKAQGWPRDAVEEEEAPPEAEPAPAAAAAPAAAVPVSKVNPEFHSPLRLLVGTRLINRSFRYTDSLSDISSLPFREPMDYPRFTLPMPRAELHWYPAGHFTQKWLSQFGIVGGFEMAFGAKLSFDGDGDGVAETPVNESHTLWYAGGRGRIPIGNVAIGLQVDYAEHRLSLSGDQDPNNPALPLFPDVAYRQVELGADFEWRMQQLIVGMHGSYNIMLGVGLIGQDVNPDPAIPTPWFPGTTGTAVDFGAYAGWRLSPVFDILIGLDMRAYGLDFGRIPPETIEDDVFDYVIAGGATDRFMSAWLALAIKLPAKGQAAPGAASAGGKATTGTSAEGKSEGESDFGAFE